jgi:hypothetical protein
LSQDLSQILSSLEGEIRSEFVWKNETGRVWTAEKYVVSRGCCVRLALSAKTVKRGESLRATVTWKQTDRLGSHRWFATVSPSDPTQPTLYFKVSAEIVPRAAIELADAPSNLGIKEVGEIAGRIMFRRTPSNDPPPIPNVQFGNKPITVSANDATLQREHQWEKWSIPIRLTLAPSQSPGVSAESLRAVWDNPSLSLQETVAWKVVPEVSLHPKLVMWSAKDPSIRRLRLIHRGAKSVAVKSTKAPDWMTIERDGDFILLNLSPSAPDKGLHHLVVATDHGDAEADIYLSGGGGRR